MRLSSCPPGETGHTATPMEDDRAPALRPDRWRRVRNRGIRARIVFGYVGLLLAALTISVLITHRVLVGRLDGDIDQSLVQEVEELRILAGGTDPQTGEPFGSDTRAVFRTFLERNVPADNEAFFTVVGGQPFLASFEPPFRAADEPALLARWGAVSEATWGRTQTVAGEVRYLAVPVAATGGDPGVFVVGFFPADDLAEIDQMVRIVAVAGLAVLLISAAFAWSLAGRVLAPVGELTRAAHRVTETDLSHRIPVAGNDELAELGTTFNAMLDRLEEGFTGQRQFLDDVAHELRTPITIVAGHLELLGNEALAGDADERAATVHLLTDELQRMSRYVDDLLVLAKAEQGELLRFNPFDLGEFAEHLHQRVRALGEREWVLDAPRPGAVAVVADEGRIMQALLNLASNAVQHTRPGDRIELGATLAGAHWVRIWVRDSGPGVDPALAEQLFQRRFRGAASRAHRSDGMGIGLSIVDAIARAHGGAATAANAAGGGAVFTVTIPSEPPHAEEAP